MHWGLVLALLACGGDDAPGLDTAEASPTASTAPPATAPSGDTGTPAPAAPEAVTAAHRLLISQFSYCGAPPAGGTDHYYSDQFVELVNADAVPLIVDGLLVGEVFGVSGAINPGTAPDSYRDARPDEVVLRSVFRVPGPQVLQPGEHLVIAHDGTNHVPFSPIDLSGADWEAFIATSGSDSDSPTVPNLDRVHFTGGSDWLMTVFGPSVVLLAPGTSLTAVDGGYVDLKAAPAEAVVDAVEALMDADSGAFKRLPDTVDRGFTHVGGIYVGEAVHRKRDATGGWVDTDDSGADFEVGAPAPVIGGGLPPGTASDEVTLALGTGTTAYTPLAPGASVELVAGSQGGWHLDVTVRSTGLPAEGVVLSYDALRTGGSVAWPVSAVTSERSVLPTADGWDRVGDRVVLDIPSADAIVGATVDLTLEATLGDQTWTDIVSVVVVDEEG